MEIQIEGLCKSFAAVHALSDVTLRIGVGMYGLLGPNGAGKTTLMRILCTLLQPTRGAVTIGDVDLIKQPQQVRRLIGYLPQEFGFFKRLTAREYLDFAGSMKGLTSRQRREQIPALLEQVNLAAESRKYIGSFSGGMKRRLGIAQALLGNPPVLVVDEPTAGLDPEERLRFRNLLAQISGDRIVLLSTHIVGDVESVCSRLAVLDGGRVRFEGRPGDLVRHAEGQVWQLDVSESEFGRLESQLRIIASRRTTDGLSLRVLAPANPLGCATPQPPTLEDGYLSLMEERASRGEATA